MSTAMAKKASPSSPNRHPTAITIRGSKEWRAWVERGAKHCMTDTSKLVDVALSQYLKAQGFAEVRPDRQGTTE